jgi:hypothetical protein
MTLQLNESDYIEFTLPFSVDADRIIDSEGREICQISGLCKPEEALRIAKLFAASYQAFTLLAGVRAFIEASTRDLPDFAHGKPDEDKKACILCSIDEFLGSVFSTAPRANSRIITE